MLLILFGQCVHTHTFDCTDGQLQLRIIGDIHAEGKMLPNARDIDVFHMDLGISAEVIGVSSVAAPAEINPVILISVYRKGPVRFLHIPEILMFQVPADSVAVHRSQVPDLLPEDQIQVHFFVQVREGKIFILMFFNIFYDSITDFRNPGGVQRRCFIEHILFQENKVDRIFPVVQAAQQTVLTVFTFCQDLQFFLHIYRGNVQFRGDL